MREAKNSDQHITESTWWQWRDGELDQRDMQTLQTHWRGCASCRQRAATLERFFATMRQAHHAVQPTLAAQMQLAQALEQQFVAAELPIILIEASRRLLRWLTPAIAILAAVFILLRQEDNVAANALASLLPETPESQLLLVDSDEQFQQAMWDVALSLEENQK